MLEFKQDDETADLILTLTENVSVDTPYYLFVFTHVVTKDVVVFLLGETDDASDYTDRYNWFTIAPVTLFAGFQPGVWDYQVFEQTDSANLDPALTGAVLESGQLLLNRATASAFAFDLYESPTSFKTYNG